MNNFIKTELFVLMNENSQEITNKQMQRAYGCFMEQIITTVSQSEQNYPDIFRMLNNTRIELVFLKTLYRYEQGEKCPEICLLSKDTILS